VSQGTGRVRVRALPAPVTLTVAWLAAGVPFSNLAAQRLRGVDLREVGSATVSGTSLYRVAGFGPLAAAGVLEVAKGSIGPLLAGPDRPALAAAAAGVAVAGHNWSPFLRGAGGRGISPAVGALLVGAPAGAAVLLGGMVLGRLGGETAVGSLVADVVLIPLVALVHGRRGALLGTAVVVPMLAKRICGNRPPPAAGRSRTYLNRLLYDRDERDKRDDGDDRDTAR
jgi:glycerol-3-phosphate acyltransferase PlsY